MASYIDIAKRAGVSIATVSHVIHETRFVSDELKGRVTEAMAELHYRPNLIAGSLRSKKTKTIGLLTPGILSLYYTELANKLQDTFFQHGYNMILSDSLYDVEKEAACVETLRSKRVDGIILFPASADFRNIKELIDVGLPLVVLGCHTPGVRVSQVHLDNFQVGVIVTEHLIECGHRRILYVDREIDHIYSIERRKGCVAALAKHRVDMDDCPVLRWKGFDSESGLDIITSYLRENRRPAAIFAYNDEVAMGCIRAIVDSGLQVPRDIAVAGCNNSLIAATFVPRLTTVDSSIAQIAEAATNLLLAQMNQVGKKVVRDVVFKPKLIVRESTVRRSRK